MLGTALDFESLLVTYPISMAADMSVSPKTVLLEEYNGRTARHDMAHSFSEYKYSSFGSSAG